MQIDIKPLIINHFDDKLEKKKLDKDKDDDDNKNNESIRNISLYSKKSIMKNIKIKDTFYYTFFLIFCVAYLFNSFQEIENKIQNDYIFDEIEDSELQEDLTVISLSPSTINYNDKPLSDFDSSESYNDKVEEETNLDSMKKKKVLPLLKCYSQYFHAGDTGTVAH